MANLPHEVPGTDYVIYPQSDGLGGMVFFVRNEATKGVEFIENTFVDAMNRLINKENRMETMMTEDECVKSGQHGLLLMAGVFHEHSDQYDEDEDYDDEEADDEEELFEYKYLVRVWAPSKYDADYVMDDIILNLDDNYDFEYEIDSKYLIEDTVR